MKIAIRVRGLQGTEELRKRAVDQRCQVEVRGPRSGVAVVEQIGGEQSRHGTLEA